MVRPGIVFLENVPGLALGGLGPVLGTLAEVGLHAEWATLRASAVGAPHRRSRLFVLAYDDRTRLSGLSKQSLGAEGGEQASRRRDAERCDQGAREHLDDPRGAGLQGRESGAEGQGGRPGDMAPHAESVDSREAQRGEAAEGLHRACLGGLADSSRFREREPHQETCAKPRHDARKGSSWRGSLFPPGPADDWSRVPWQLWPALTKEAESSLRGLADGVALVDSRLNFLRMLGNGVVPQQAEAAFRGLARRMIQAGNRDAAQILPTTPARDVRSVQPANLFTASRGNGKKKMRFKP